MENCKRCGLYKFRNKQVEGRYIKSSDILFIGEAPGKSENVRGIAFCGLAGVVLRKGIKAAEETISKNFKASYSFTNCIQCRPNP